MPNPLQEQQLDKVSLVDDPDAFDPDAFDIVAPAPVSPENPNARKKKPKRTWYQFNDDIARGQNIGANAKEQIWADGQHKYTDAQDDDFYANEFYDNELNQAEALFKPPESEKNIQLLHDNLNAHKKTLYSDLRYLSSYDKMHYLSAWNLAKENQLKDASDPDDLKKEIISLRAAILFLASDMQKVVTITDRLKQTSPYYIQAFLAGNAVKYSGHIAHNLAKKTGAYTLGRHIAKTTGADVLAGKAVQKASEYGSRAAIGAADYTKRAAQSLQDLGQSASKTLKSNVAFAKHRYHNLPPISTFKKSVWPFSGGKTRKRRARRTRRTR